MIWFFPGFVFSVLSKGQRLAFVCPGTPIEYERWRSLDHWLTYCILHTQCCQNFGELKLYSNCIMACKHNMFHTIVGGWKYLVSLEPWPKTVMILCRIPAILRWVLTTWSNQWSRFFIFLSHMRFAFVLFSPWSNFFSLPREITHQLCFACYRLSLCWRICYARISVMPS